MKKFSRFTWLSLVMALLLIPTGMFAQTSSTTGAITGTVTDGQGNALPGVTVTATSPSLQGSRIAVTDTQGDYVLPSLPPGRYRVEYSLTGLQTITRENVTVSLTQTSKLNVPMQITITETVTVTAGTVVVDPTSTQTQQNFKEDHLKYAVVGSANRSYQNVLQQAPNVAGGANPNVAGANDAQNVYQIDGINNMTDPVTHTFGANFGFDAIQEISVLTFGKDAEYRSSGGTVNIVTKSGGNNFSGSFDWRYNDPDFLTQGKRFLDPAPLYFGGPPNPAGTRTRVFNKDIQTNKSSQPQATFGGPIMRDRIWFFASAHNPLTNRQAANTVGIQPGPRKFLGWNNFGKLTFTPFANHTFSGRYLDSHATITNISFSSFRGPDADAFQAQHVKSYALGWDGILSSHWLANVQAGYTPSSLSVDPQTGDRSLVSIVDAANSIRTVNYTSWQFRDAYRREVTASTTYYLESFGSHAFKVGGNIEKNGFSRMSGSTGDLSRVPGLPSNACGVITNNTPGITCGVQLQYNGGVPQFAFIVPSNPLLSVSSRSQAIFGQDQWNPISQLTLRLGLRYDTVTWNTQRDVPNFKLLQPRIGAAYDIFNNGATVIKAFGGKVIDENQLTLASNTTPGVSGSATYRYNAATGAYALSSNGVFLTGTGADQNLKVPFSNQYSLGIAQRLARNTFLEVTAEQRHMHHMFDDWCGHVDPNVGLSSYVPLDECVFTNLPAGVNALQSEYRGIVTKLESRAFNNMDLVISWAHGTSKSSTSGQDLGEAQNVGGIVDYYPLNFTNIYGYTADDARNRVKVNGFYRLPWDLTVGGNYYWDSGTPFTVFRADPLGFGYNIFLEPRGSRRLPSYSQLDLQLQKDFTFMGVKAGVIGSVLNVLNTETTTAVSGNAGTRAITDPATGRLYMDPNQQTGPNRLSATFMRPSAFQLPRRFEVGVRFEF